jgi:hypothetical protein
MPTQLSVLGQSRLARLEIAVGDSFTYRYEADLRLQTLTSVAGALAPVVGDAHLR